MNVPVWALAVSGCIASDGLVVLFLAVARPGRSRDPEPEITRDLVDKVVQQRVLRSLGRRTLVHSSPVRWEEPLEYPLAPGWDEDDVLCLLTEIEAL